MKKARVIAAVAAGLVAVAAPAAVWAHFILVTPKSWLIENTLGDPQKAGPCGGKDDNSAILTNVITPMTGGDMIHIQVKETIYHPGFFRVALSVLDRAELPADPEATTKDSPRGPISVAGKVDPYPKPPVLVDGIFMHHERKPAEVFDVDVKLPNINCDKCSLQIIQFMEEHGENAQGRFTYHHCADLKITANPKLKIDAAWPGQKPAPKAKAAKKPA